MYYLQHLGSINRAPYHREHMTMNEDLYDINADQLVLQQLQRDHLNPGWSPGSHWDNITARNIERRPAHSGARGRAGAWLVVLRLRRGDVDSGRLALHSVAGSALMLANCDASRLPLPGVGCPCLGFRIVD
ncbi:unnamed protein product [Amoebophrya sp. A25]|nr:unnamed protein product [Amoebophrya sp. A25]|eukprot:GSA25T00014343001.1